MDKDLKPSERGKRVSVESQILTEPLIPRLLRLRCVKAGCSDSVSVILMIAKIDRRTADGDFGLKYILLILFSVFYLLKCHDKLSTSNETGSFVF